jgi:adenylate kinase family enzyme
MGVPHIELDALHWERGWQPAPLEVFRQRVDAATAGPAWVADGNYHQVRDLTWGRATAVVWLDLPLRTHLWRIVSRSLRRWLRGELLWNTNRETLWGSLLGPESMVVWLLRSYWRRRRETPERLARPEHRGLRVVRLRSADGVQAWLAAHERDDAATAPANNQA